MEWNVRDSDGTLILLITSPIGGTLLTIEFAKKLCRPYLIINISTEKNYLDNIKTWILQNNIQVLNIAGSRQGENKNICSKTYQFLNELLN